MNVGTIQMMIFWSIIFLIKIEAYASFNRQNQEEIDRIGKVILEDTYLYKSDLNWTVHNEQSEDYDEYSQYDYEEWEDLTGEDQRRSYMVCDTDTLDVHWLRSKYIKLPKNYQQFEITIDIEYSFPKCREQARNCESTFNVYKFESTTDKANDKFPEWTEARNGYQKLKTIAAQDRFNMSDPNKSSHVSKEVIRFRPNKSGFYVAFSTSGTCMALTRVQIYYHMCEELYIGLSKFPESPAERSAKRVHGTCLQDAVYVGSRRSNRSNQPSALCGNDGKWINEMSMDQCQCRAGFQSFYRDELETKKGCERCPRNTYKSEATDDRCIQCPLNKESESGAKHCKCKKGFRSEPPTDMSEMIDNQCYKPASAPKITIDLVTTTSVKFRIDQPKDKSEYSKLEYEISICSTQSDNSYDCKLKDHVLRYQNFPRNGKEESGLKPETDYEIKVKARNIVTRVDDDFNLSLIPFHTRQQKPTEIGMIRHTLIQNENKMKIDWDPVDASYYILKVITPMKNNIEHNLTEPSYEQENLIPGEYILSVYGVNEAGDGIEIVKKVVIEMDDTLPIHMYAVAGASGLLFVILFIVAAYCCCCKQNNKIPKDHRTEEGTGLFSGEKENQYPTNLSPTSNQSARPLNNYEIGPEELMPSFHCMEINPIDIQIETCLLGEGEFAEVRKAYVVNKLGERMPVAAKKLKSGVGMRAQLDFLEEGQILMGFDHPSIISLKGVVTKYRPLMILTEFMENGALDEYLRRNKGKITVLEMIQILNDVAGGCEYLQSKGFIHRDLAARNILVDEKSKSKISDFGLSRLMDTVEDNLAIYMAHGGKVAIKWTSPEAIKHKIFTHASDVWSFGVLCWEVMTYGDRPFWDMPNDEVIKSISMGLRLPCPQGCPQAMHDLMLKCWAEEPNRRPTFGQIRAELEEFLRDPSLLNGNDGIFSESSTVSYNSQDNRMSSFYTTLQ